MPHPAGFNCLPSPPGQWPALPSRVVSIGGVPVTFDRASRDLAVLEAAGGVAIRQVLAAAASPLAACDYLSALQPYREPPVSRNGYGRGAAGRPAARQAFMRAIRAALDGARREEPARHFAAETGAARDAFSSDEGYAAAMAKAAVAILRRDHDAWARSLLSAAAAQAVLACAARTGEFACAASSACGTGDCRLAASALAAPGMTAAAPAGRLRRPANHVNAGEKFGLAAALAALEAVYPFDVAAAVSSVRLASGDLVTARDAVPAGAA